MLGMLGYGLMFVVDVAMAGHLGETALAASALASNLNYIPYVFGIGVVGAIAVYQSQDNGAGVEESSPAILRHGMTLAVVISIVAAILSHWAARFIPLLGSPEPVAAASLGQVYKATLNPALSPRFYSNASSSTGCRMHIKCPNTACCCRIRKSPMRSVLSVQAGAIRQRL